MFLNDVPGGVRRPPTAEAGDRFGQSGLMSSPSRVLYFRHLPDYATDSEINAACAPFGVVTNILKLLNKKEAFVEFASLQSAQKFMHNTGGNTIVRGKHVKVVYSDRQNLTLHTDLHETPPNNILFVLVTLLLHPVDVDTLYQVFSMAGRVRKVAISPKNGQIQGFVEMESVQEAATAKEQFNGKHIFTGSCHMQIQFSRLTSIDAKLCAKDYTVENQGQPSLLSTPPGALGPPAYPMASTGIPPAAPPPPMQPAYGTSSTMTYQPPPPQQPQDDGSQMWQQQAQLYPAPPATSYQRVLWVKNVDERATPQILFNLFGTAGDVMKVKKLFRKRDMALLEFRDSSQAWSALTNLNRCPLIGKILQVSWSHHPYLMSTGAEDDGLTQDFSNSDMHRFRKPESRNFDHIRPPCDTLHISCNIPLDPEALASLFWQYGAVQSCELFKTDNTRATIKMDSVESAVHALVALHGYVMDPTAQGHEKYSGKGIWIAFAACKPRPARGRPRLEGAPPQVEDPSSYYSGYPTEPESFGTMLPPPPPPPPAENYDGFQPSYGPSGMNRYGHQ
uniref:Polypyrimidine tract-binding protein 1/2 n=1 Tax=Euglena gracilis TaxID=3039 RepID=A0AA51UAN1_EUGGR|nr:polypyrimidine tract-binding protein 1/2 [Euglena gracilis]BDX17176.1 polypyrimidine tract-binding protein A [Euglena gracilis]